MKAIDDLYARLDEETAQLRRYFGTNAGVNTLADFFVRAEAYRLTEPAGALHKDTGKFSFFEAPQKNGEYYIAILMDDMKKVRKLAREVRISYFMHLLFFDENAKFNKKFLGLLKRYMSGDKEAKPGVLAYYETYASGHYITPADHRGRAGEIEIHIHPHQSEGWEIADLRGYSKSDRRSSRRKTLGLIEYSKQIVQSDDRNALDLGFEVRHRALLKENMVGAYELKIDGNNLAFKNGKEGPIDSKLEPQKVSKGTALHTLTISPYMMPFIDFDHEKSGKLEDYGFYAPGTSEEAYKNLLQGVHKWEESTMRLVEAHWGRDQK